MRLLALILSLVACSMIVFAEETPVTPPVKKVTVNGVNIIFAGNNEAFVEINSQRIKINTETQSVLDLSATSATPAKSQELQTEEEIKESGSELKEAPSDEVDLEEYYGYELVNIATPRGFQKKSLTMHYTHRFTQPIFDKDSPEDLFGLDSFSFSGFGFTYGITDRLFTKIYRTPLDRNIEMGAGFKLLHQNKKTPISASIFGSLEGRNNFRTFYTGNITTMLARSFSHYGAVFFTPSISLNSNPNRNVKKGESNHTGTFGLGSQWNFTPTASLIFECTPRIGFKSQPNAAISFGIQKRTYRHVFTLSLSNTQGTTTSQYNSGLGGLGPNNLRSNLTLGFNITRRSF